MFAKLWFLSLKINKMGRGKRIQHLYSAAHRSCSGAFVSQTDRRTAYRPQSKPGPLTLTCNQTASRSFGLPFNGSETICLNI